MRINRGNFVCSCGYIAKPDKEHVNEEIKSTYVLKIVESTINPLAAHKHKCSKCGFGKAQLASKGIQYSDEDEELYFVCGKCGHHDKPDGLKVT